MSTPLAGRLMAGLRDADRMDAAAALALRITGAGLTLITQLVAARWLGLSEFGAFSNAWVWATLAAALAQAGFASTTTRFASSYREERDGRSLLGLVIFSQAVALGLGLVAILVITIIASLPAIGLGPAQVEALTVGALAVPFLAQIDIGKGLTRAAGSAALAYLPGMLLRPAFFLVGIAALIGIGAVPDAATAMWASLAAVIGAWIVQALIAARRLRPFLATSAPCWSPGRWSRVSVGVLVSDAYLLVVASVDVILLNLLASAEAGGAYFAAAKLAALTSYVLFAVSAVAQGRFAALAAQNSTGRLEAASRRFCRLALWPTFAAAAGLAIAGPALLDLFGEGFRQAAGPLLVLVAAYVVQAATGPVRVLLVMTGRQKPLAILLTACAVLCIILNLVLIPVLDLWGAAWAFFITTTVASTGMALLARHALGFWCLPLPAPSGEQG
ncbi:MAG: lipopolysaccharide biosynthesis protein [Salinarimonas sp.]|nr:lipopolysaccharide biosynthesis protein [Salinarimonas sp.]